MTQHTKTKDVISVEEAKNALIEMMRESDVYDWGGRKKIYIPDHPLQDPRTFPVEYIDDPIEVPEEMNRTERLDDGTVKIGFWDCDLRNKTFSTGWGNEHFYTTYEGEFIQDKNGKWKAEYHLGAHGHKGP